MRRNAQDIALLLAMLIDDIDVAWPDLLRAPEDGSSRDAAMLALLRNGRARDLENMVAHSQPGYAHPTGNLPAGVNFASDNSYSGPSFFERLFGPPTPPAAVGRRQQQQRRVITR